MPGRNIPIITDQIYHIFNRGIAKQPTFLSKYHYERFVNTLGYYQSISPPMAFSRFIRLEASKRPNILNRIYNSDDKAVSLLSYCLMPNHFHLLVRQETDNGIPKLMSNLINSYTRYFNLKKDRIGPLFEGKFKAVLIEDDEQLLHISRYIHLNPYTSYLVKNINELISYPYSSLKSFLDEDTSNILDIRTILNSFNTKKGYEKFIFNQIEYQRKLGEIKHLIFD